jgi:hypothetical protein
MKGDTFRPRGDDALAVLGAEEAEHTHADCFADEVVIDFPSVHSAVQKMRHAFVESDPCRSVRADIQLSRQQATCGVSLPLVVPVRATCRSCGGRGETWSEPCTRCGASGTEVLRHQVQVHVPPGVSDGARFRFTVAMRSDPPTRVELHVAVQVS